MDTKPMIRKQLYITREQDHALKRQARELGVSEAEFVRRALDEAVRENPPCPQTGPDDPLTELLANTRRLAARHRLPAGYRFDRDELYERGA
jgi:hypothetical protein